MKRFIFLLFFILLNFCGCVVSEREVFNQNCFDEKILKVRIVIPKFFSQEIEQRAVEFQRRRPDVLFEFIRVEDDAIYKKVVLNEILNKDADVFYVHGEKDVSFFKDLIKNFSFNGKKEKVKYINNLPVFVIERNFFGIYYNSNLLNSFGVDEKEIDSYDSFIRVVRNIEKNPKNLKKSEIVGVGDDFSTFVSSLGLLDGNISVGFKDIFKFKKQDETDLGLNFLADRQLFFIGGSRYFDFDLFTKIKNHIKCVPLFIAKNRSIIYEDDCFCLVKNLMKEKEGLILEFLDFASNFNKEIKDKTYEQRESDLKNMPLGFRFFLQRESFNLIAGKINFDVAQKSFKRYYDRFKNLD